MCSCPHVALLLMAWKPGGLGFPNIFTYICMCRLLYRNGEILKITKNLSHETVYFLLNWGRIGLEGLLVWRWAVRR